MTGRFIIFGLMLLATVATGPAGGREIDAGRLGSLPLVLPAGAVQGVVFLFSDRSGWNAELDRAAARLSALGAAVLEVDLPAYLAHLGHSDDRDCHYLISEVEQTSKRLQRELGWGARAGVGRVRRGRRLGLRPEAPGACARSA